VGRELRYDMCREFLDHRFGGPASILEVKQDVVCTCALESLQSSYQPTAPKTVASMDRCRRFVRVGGQIDVIGLCERLEGIGRDCLDGVVPLSDQLYLAVERALIGNPPVGVLRDPFHRLLAVAGDD
jgi:hypothetical protein